jgi:hypothetical protein
MESTPQPIEGQEDIASEERHELIGELSKVGRDRYADLLARLAR